MKKSMVLLMMMNLMVISAFGQRQRNDVSAEDRAERTISRLEQRMEFTAKERTGMLEIYVEFYKKFREYRQERNREKMTELTEERDKKVKSLLDEKKYKQYQDILKEIRQNRQQRGSQRGRPGRQE